MQLADFTDQLPTLLSLDPPRHTELRRRLYAFTPKVVRGLEARMRAVVRASFDAVRKREICDFSQDVVRPLPLAIVCDLLGVPETDRERVGAWADLLAGAADPEIAQGGKTGTQGALEFGTCASELAQKHGGAGGGDDLLHVLMNAELEGEQMDLPTFCGLFVQIAIAGNETTRSTRYASADRDEEVFAEPERFGVRRDPNPHFGFGEHFCLGAALGRLEGRVFLEKFFRRFAGVELAGEPVRLRSGELDAWKRMPVRLRERRP